MTICPLVDMLVISIFKAGPFLVGSSYAINIRAGRGKVKSNRDNSANVRPASGGVARSRAARTGCGLRGSGSGAPQAGRKAVGGSEGGAGDSILGPLGGSAARSACPNPENPPKNGSFSFVADPEAPFLPILPQDLSAVAPAAKIFRSQGSKSDPVLHIQYPPAWADVVENGGIRKWRRERDSNPRPACAGSGFQDRRVRPLRHLSTVAGIKITQGGGESQADPPGARAPRAPKPGETRRDGGIGCAGGGGEGRVAAFSIREGTGV